MGVEVAGSPFAGYRCDVDEASCCTYALGRRGDVKVFSPSDIFPQG